MRFDKPTDVFEPFCLDAIFFFENVYENLIRH